MNMDEHQYGRQTQVLTVPHIGVVLNSFARKWLLRRPWANLARFLRDHSPVFVPRFRDRFRVVSYYFQSIFL